MALEIGGRKLALEEVERWITAGGRVALSRQAARRVDRARKVIEDILAKGRTVYGVNTGFGKLATVKISQDKIDELQLNLIRSHTVGTGEPLPERVVRLILLLRAHSLAQGYSGIRRGTLEALLAMLNRGVLPVVPSRGSVGASGDLAPLAHVAHALIGEGEVVYKGRKSPAAKAMKSAGLKPVKLAAKEGLALINGTSVMLAILTDALAQARALVKVADVAGAMSLEALMGSLKPFDARVHRLRAHPGQAECAANFRVLLRGSNILLSHRDCSKVQDSYCLRCIPQVHGAVRDTLRHVQAVAEAEINAVTDNPLVFPERGDVISAGNFHGEPVAFAADFLAIALAELAGISERRIETMVNPDLSGLPPFLTNQSGLNSGLMMVQVTAAALVSENKVLAHPASVDSIPTSANQEDHVSMGVTAALKCAQILENVKTVLAIETLCAFQGLHFQKPKPGKGVAAAYRAVGGCVRPLVRDRALAWDIQRLRDYLFSADYLKRVGDLK